MARQTCRTNWEQARVQAAALLAQGGRTGGGRSRETAAVSVPLEEEEHRLLWSGYWREWPIKTSFCRTCWGRSTP